MTRAQWTALKTAVRGAHMADLAPRYAPKTLVFDGIAQTVTAEGRSVTVLTGARNVPAGLRALMVRLARLTSSALR